MLEQFLNLEWFQSFAICSVIQMYLEKSSLSKRKSQIIACILFQTYFVLVSLKLVYVEYILNENTDMDIIKNLNNLYGYFIFDTIYLITENPQGLFIIHHIASLIIISICRYNITPFHNILCFLSEAQNPILNMRHLTSDYPVLKKLNNKLLFWTYLIFRIILFPIFSILFLMHYYNSILLAIFTGLYSISIVWFIKINKLNKPVDNAEVYLDVKKCE